MHTQSKEGQPDNDDDENFDHVPVEERRLKLGADHP